MSDYQTEKNKIYTERIRALLHDLPPFCREFFRGIENSTSVLTRFAYANDLKLFFNYLIAQHIVPGDINTFALCDLDQIKAEHIEMFLEYVGYYTPAGGIQRKNHERAKARKLSAVRSLLKYFFKKEKLSSNVGALVDIPKINEKQIIRLDANEVADFLDATESGQALSPRQQVYHALTKTRDMAILTLLLGTGIRVSELVGLNINDVDFEKNRFVVTRKGGDQAVLYFGEEVNRSLSDYVDARKKIFANDDALFLSLQKKRLHQRSVQLLVKKYSRAAVPLKKISPHKLRSTYGTMLYQETGDIYLVADVLGHKDVNTTKKHYAAIEEDRRKLAAKVIKLRED